MHRRIKILIVDDHRIFRVGVKSALTKQPDIRVIAEACNHEEAIEAYRLHKPDVVILDLRMPGRGGLDTLHDIQKLDNNAKVLVLSSFANEEEVHQTISAGAKGYLLKDVGTEELVGAIKAIYSGKSYIPPSIRSVLASRDTRANLTPRELDVLGLIVKGLTNPEIATVLGTSQNTIRNQTISIFAKLEVTDRAEAVGVALQRGFVISTE
jgi:DNA-binding NarL/FixJ family response regulator